LENSPRCQAVIERRCVNPQHHHQVDPALGEQVARVPVYYPAALLDLILDGIEKLWCLFRQRVARYEMETMSRLRRRSREKYLILIHNPALILLIPPLVALAVLDHVVDRQVLEPCALGQQLAVAGLASAGGARDDDVGQGASHFPSLSLLSFPPVVLEVCWQCLSENGWPSLGFEVWIELGLSRAWMSERGVSVSVLAHPKIFLRVEFWVRRERANSTNPHCVEPL